MTRPTRPTFPTRSGRVLRWGAVVLSAFCLVWATAPLWGRFTAALPDALAWSVPVAQASWPVGATLTVVAVTGAGVRAGRTVPVVVLGARLNDDCTPPQVLDDRLDAAADLAKAHLLNPVIVTGGETAPDCPTEAQAMDAGLRARGVPNQVIEENKAGSTVENVANTADTINSRGGLAVVVTSTPHNVRALQNFRDAGIEAVAYTGGEG